MTRLVRVHLGTAPGQYKLAVDGCSAFKRQLRSVLATPNGASLLTIDDRGTMRVEAVYSSDIPGAECWAKRAAELAPEVWATIATRRAGRGR